MNNWSNSRSIDADDPDRLRVANICEDLVKDYLGPETKKISAIKIGSLYDLLAFGLRIDVKAKRRNFPPKLNYDAHVEASQMDYPADVYVFCSFHKITEKAEPVGWIWKFEFDSQARFVREGDKDGGKFAERCDAYKIKHHLLRNMEDLKAMSEFWIIKDAAQITERLVFFERWLRDNWNWEYPVQFKVGRYQEKRSLSQNALFHVWCREMADHFSSKGADITEATMKELLKYKFLGTEDRVIHKTVIPAQVRETSGLGRGEMMDFMDQVQSWALDHGVKLTCPIDSEYMKLKGG